ncbi:signal sequence receptor alpha chain [Sporothrix schenckii 1099-18]|uniref:Signal sequence receptor alpha chain n=1 Tax=Sporothrix schenckii 1099-18 TaxID=1397361 RepID=A0A0F2LZI2_SPOSC|nr:signal sequence receptor alpha chain [Sporothrix schenckii 1099-18]KJR82868.1 signal sequence receptor alpha chain [Sporothrix schenckii 1099-18]
MVSFKLSAVALFALQVLGVATAVEEPLAGKAAAEVKIDVDTKFPEADIFGLKLINGRATKAIVEITNQEDSPVRVSILGGALVNPQLLPEGVSPSANIVVNLTTVSFEGSKDAVLQPGEKRGYPYNFVLDLQPRELRLDLMAIVTNAKGQLFQVIAHSDTATIVDPPINIFDPQMCVIPWRSSVVFSLSLSLSLFPANVCSIFLYVFLTGVFGATLYFVYKTWIEALFPQAKRSSGGRKARKVAAAAEAASADALSGNESTGAGTGAEDFDASWIPAHHINRPVAKRVKSGASKKKATAE